MGSWICLFFGVILLALASLIAGDSYSHWMFGRRNEALECRRWATIAFVASLALFWVAL